MSVILLLCIALSSTSSRRRRTANYLINGTPETPVSAITKSRTCGYAIAAKIVEARVAAMIVDLDHNEKHRNNEYYPMDN
jgi:hypothetical protein